MAEKIRCSAITVAFMAMILLAATSVFSDDTIPVPADKAQVTTWFNANVKPLAERKDLDPPLVTAEKEKKVIKVMKDGSGDFTTITDAIKSIPAGNTKRVIVHIGGGVYNEKIKIERSKPFITLYGSPNNMPNLTFGGTAFHHGTVDSASLIVEPDYFVAANIIISNSAPRPDGKRAGAQALALRISGDKATFYNCKLFGFQDTLCDDKGKHFFKDCMIQGTVDFIFGSGKSIYLNTQLNVLGDSGMTVIAAQARVTDTNDIGYSFVHCEVTGTGTGTYLGRAWTAMPRVIYAYSTMSGIVNPEGWSDNMKPENDKTVYFGEYKNSGPGADPSKRAKFTKQLTEAEAKPYLTLGFIEGSKWLLPAPTL
ncbi:hypothetical protein L6164_005551 [Bauhinia variegata]|uniref:Uncharacterized protein n=1 Tax=Bauhinia variegata TaxID=167791 RepID=A0ACB9PRN1_BAUVA|nr:hypothetical protein L6164_005551 [Bauhinia variegata]